MTSSPSTNPPQKFNLQDPATKNLPCNIGNKYMTKTKEVGRLTRKFEEGSGSDPSVERIKGDGFKPFLKTSLEGLGSSSKKVLGKRNMVHEDEENKKELVQKNGIKDNQEDGNQENENNGDDGNQVNENNGDDGNQEDDNGEDEKEEEDENGDDEEDENEDEEMWYNFLVNVYERMPDDRERYQQFLRYFDNFGSGLMTLRQLRLLVEDVIGNFEDLMEEFKSFFAHYYGEDYENIEDYYENEEVGMFKVEDQKFESHMLLQWLRSSCEYLREIKETGGFDESFGTIKKIVFRRCVERMWGDYADDVVDMFYKDCQGMAQMILDRMQQKAEELRQYRNHLKANVWRCQRM